jgi:hypothetical protein
VIWEPTTKARLARNYERLATVAPQAAHVCDVARSGRELAPEAGKPAAAEAGRAEGGLCDATS